MASVALEINLQLEGGEVLRVVLAQVYSTNVGSDQLTRIGVSNLAGKGEVIWDFVCGLPSLLLIETDKDFWHDILNIHTSFGAMIKEDIVERSLRIKLDRIKTSADSEPAYMLQDQGVTTNKAVLDGLSDPVTWIVCPGSKVPSVGYLLLTNQLLVVSSVAETRARPGLVNYGL